jgi:hypothetical protein
MTPVLFTASLTLSRSLSSLKIKAFSTGAAIVFQDGGRWHGLTDLDRAAQQKEGDGLGARVPRPSAL